LVFIANCNELGSPEETFPFHQEPDWKIFVKEDNEIHFLLQRNVSVFAENTACRQPSACSNDIRLDAKQQTGERQLKSGAEHQNHLTKRTPGSYLIEDNSF
jgi:hypothetical protein